MPSYSVAADHVAAAIAAAPAAAGAGRVCGAGGVGDATWLQRRRRDATPTVSLLMLFAAYNKIELQQLTTLPITQVDSKVCDTRAIQNLRH